MALTALVSIDGLRPDAIEQARCPRLLAFRDSGAYTMSARSVMPSITLPCHTSIFHSVPPSRHGLMTNLWTPMARPLPGLVEVAFQAGKRCAFFYNWEQLRDLSRPGHLEYSFFLNNRENLGIIDPGMDDHIAREASRVLSGGGFDFAFIYFGTVDVAGHAYGWMSAEYLAQVQRVDRAFGTLLDALPAESTVLVQSDHGGHDRSHGTDAAEDMTIPWMMAGPSIKRDHRIAASVSLLDTAPTLAKVMALNVPGQWEGQGVAEAFRA